MSPSFSSVASAFYTEYHKEADFTICDLVPKILGFLLFKSFLLSVGSPVFSPVTWNLNVFFWLLNAF